MQKEMSAERLDFIRLSIEKKFKPENEKPETVMEQLFGVIVRCSAWMNEQVMIKFIIGDTTLYDKTDEEKAEYEKQRNNIGFLYRMMIYAANGVADKDLANWDATYCTSNGKIVMELDEILSKFGFSYSREEFYKIAEGSHELFKDGEKNE